MTGAGGILQRRRAAHRLGACNQACHDGSHSQEAMLGGARADERRAAEGGGQ